MKINKKHYPVFLLLLMIFPLVLLSRVLAEPRNELIIFLQVNNKEGERIEIYRSFLNLLEKYPEIRLNLSFSPPVLQTWVTQAPDLLEKLKSLRSKKQISIVLPPFYQPILPLICDYNPAVSFSYPIDIREQMVRSWELSQQIFESLPKGMVPPAGAISPATLDILKEFEIEWVVTGSGETLESGYVPFMQYVTETGREGYLFLRENELSEYWEKISLLPEDDAQTIPVKENIKKWISQIGEKNYPLTVITWEGIPKPSTLGEKESEIIKQLFEQISQLRFITYTAEDYIRENRPANRIRLTRPLSWQKNGFSVWTDKLEKRAAWRLLEQARATVEKYKNSGQAEIKILDNIFEEIYWCEFGDNFRRFGEPVYPDSEIIELNFRLKLINIYRLIGQGIPEELFHPLAAYASFGSLPSEEETKIEIDENERSFSLIDPSGDSFDERFDLKNFSCRERVNSSDEEEIVFSFTFTDPVISSEAVTSPEIIISSGFNSSGETIIVSTEETKNLEEMLVYDIEVKFSSDSYQIEPSTPIKAERISVDLYIDLNNRVGAGSVALLSGRKASIFSEDAWEYSLTTEISTSGIKEAKLYRAKENNISAELGKFPVVINGLSAFSVAIPKEMLYGKPMNWGYLIALFKEKIDYPEGISAEKTTFPEMEIIDLISPRGKTQKQVLAESENNLSLPAVRIR